MKLNKYDIILGLLIIAEIALCIYIGISGNNNYFCTQGSECDSVQNSIYGTLFGIKLAWFGVICFSILFILFLIARVNKKMYWMFFTSSVLGMAFAVYFISLQIFILQKLCKDCLIIDSIMVLMFVIVVFEFIDFRKEVREIEQRAERFVKKI
ncbi:MAG: vitamin K epoxide reductase family protein [Nanoarchaeota archaeon]